MPTTGLTVEVLLTPEDLRESLLADARRGLTARPKSLSPVWFYDEHGSALFDEITRLPEYYLTRAERGLLEAHAAEIAAAAGADTLVELGSGTSDKTRLLLDAMTATGRLHRYAPLDVSEDTLRAAAAAVAREYPAVEVHAVVADFHRHLDALPGGRRRLVAFLGSTIGNLTPEQRRRFLFDLDCALTCDDRLLLGVDLVKDPGRLVAAYDDARGVTAAFNRNALSVLNRMLDASFDPGMFEHVAEWNADDQWMDIRLRATTEHVVKVGALDLDVRFQRGEDLHTEISAKFTPERIVDELAYAGFVSEGTWGGGGDFMLVLARPYC
ncbi:MAG: L-histidine N(alpha)-methyltransferase [Actinobacteria bacterium]|nr:L-histidine N(alpha)-methyltransferase [Actinomycetota bacterium]MBW3650141.1 L-histidine N(alpha)-methyltransferase [Actinomycetota bacterium]